MSGAIADVPDLDVSDLDWHNPQDAGIALARLALGQVIIGGFTELVAEIANSMRAEFYKAGVQPVQADNFVVVCQRAAVTEWARLNSSSFHPEGGRA
jgi:hypothetical protein